MKLSLVTKSTLAAMLVSGSLMAAPVVHADSNSSNLDGVKITRVQHKDVLDIQIPVSVLKKAGLDAGSVPQDSNYQVNIGSDKHDTTIASGTTQTSGNGQNMVISMDNDLVANGDLANMPLTVTVNDDQGHQIVQIKNVTLGDLAKLAQGAQSGPDVKIDHNSNDNSGSGYSKATIQNNGKDVKVSDTTDGASSMSTSGIKAHDSNDGGTFMIDSRSDQYGQGDTGQRSQNNLDNERATNSSNSQNTSGNNEPGAFVPGTKVKDPNDGEEYVTPNTRNKGGNGDANSSSANTGVDSQGQGDTGQRSQNNGNNSNANGQNGNHGANANSNKGADVNGQGDTGQRSQNNPANAANNGNGSNGQDSNAPTGNTLPQTGLAMASQALSGLGAGLMSLLGIFRKYF